MHFVTKATPIACIDGKCYIKKLKSSRTCLTGYSAFVSHEQFLIAWGVDTHTHTRTRTRTHTRTRTRTHTHTHTHTNTPTSAQKQFQETRHAWFKNKVNTYVLHIIVQS